MHEHLERLKYISKLINNTYYKDYGNHLVDMFELSKNAEVLKSPKLHFELQKGIVKILEELEPLVTQGRKQAKTDNDSELKAQADRNRLIASAYREIADGLAWRTLGNDRIRLRILAQSQTPGFIATPLGSKDGRKAELKYGGNVVSNDCFVLLHDITNCLLVGDLSMVKKIGARPHLAEVKTKGLRSPASILRKIDKKAKLSKQENKLLQAQIMLEEDRVISGNKEAVAYHFNNKVKNFHPQAQRAINQARLRGFSSTQPTDYLLLEITDFRNPKIDLDKVKAATKRRHGEFALPFSNYDNLLIKLDGHVMRAKPPYTVYPYKKARDIIDLMTGGLYMFAEVYIEPLKTVFREQGWELEINIPDDQKTKPESEMFGGKDLFVDINQDELFITLTHTATTFNVKLGMDFLAKIGHEFLSVESCLAPIEEHRKEVIKAGRSANNFVYAVNDAEKDIWK